MDGTIHLGPRLRFALSLTCLIIGVGTVFTGTLIFRLIPAEAASVYVLTLVLFYIGTGLCWVVVAGALLNLTEKHEPEGDKRQMRLDRY